MPEIASSIMAELKSATRAQHESVETLVGFEAAIRDLLSYRRLLEKFYGFYAPTEQQLGRVAGLEKALPDFASRMKTHLLRDDLNDLGGDASTLPLCHNLPVLTTVAEAIGCLYVLEGATLGGQILSRQAKNALAISPEYAGKFFSSYGSQVGSMWKRFSQSADAYCDLHPLERGAVVKSATDSFSALSNWMAVPRSSEPAVR
jgi:heme oxygenase